MNKPILKNCPHCGGEISFRVFADKRRKHTKYVLSVKCEDCKTVTTICTKERGGAAFAALADKWNVRTDTKPPHYVEHANCKCSLKPESNEPESIEVAGVMLKPCPMCGGRNLYFRTEHLVSFDGNGVNCIVSCDCGATSPPYIENERDMTRVDIERIKRNAAALWNHNGVRL